MKTPNPEPLFEVTPSFASGAGAPGRAVSPKPPPQEKHLQGKVHFALFCAYAYPPKTRNSPQHLRILSALSAKAPCYRSYRSRNKRHGLFRIPTLLASLCFLASLSFAAGNVSSVRIHHEPLSSGKYVGSPSIAILGEQTLIASHDLFNSSDYRGQTHTYLSTDNGESWTHSAAIDDISFAKLFTHNNTLYLLGRSKGGDGVPAISASSDNGATWETPVEIHSVAISGTPTPVIEHEGRIWRAYGSAMTSAPADAETLLDPAAWTFTPRYSGWADLLPPNPSATPQDQGFSEGNPVVTPEGEMIDMTKAKYYVPGDDRAAFLRLSGESLSTTPTLDPVNDIIQMPGARLKFTVLYDSASGYYYSLSSHIPLAHYRDINGNTERVRNTIALIRSGDLRDWEIMAIPLYHEDAVKHAYQYLDWEIQGDDIVAVSRSAAPTEDGGPSSQHNANLLTFHRITDFRNATLLTHSAENAPIDELLPVSSALAADYYGRAVIVYGESDAANPPLEKSTILYGDANLLRYPADINENIHFTQRSHLHATLDTATDALDSLITPTSPAILILATLQNDLILPGADSDSIIEKLDTLTARFFAANPDARFILLSPLPNRENRSHWESFQSFTAQLSQHYSGNLRLSVIDITTPLIEALGNETPLTTVILSDKRHLANHGYEVLADSIDATLQQYWQETAPHPEPPAPPPVTGYFNTTHSSPVWNAAGNWLDGITPNGVGHIADFSTVSIASVSYRKVEVDKALTLGSLILGDTSGGNRIRFHIHSAANNQTLLFDNQSSPSLLSVGPGSTGGGNDITLNIQVANDLYIRLFSDSNSIINGTITPKVSVEAETYFIQNMGTGNGTLTINASLSDNGSTTLALIQNSKTSALILSGNNTHGGNTTLLSGSLVNTGNLVHSHVIAHPQTSLSGQNFADITLHPNAAFTPSANASAKTLRLHAGASITLNLSNSNTTTPPILTTENIRLESGSVSLKLLNASAAIPDGTALIKVTGDNPLSVGDIDLSGDNSRGITLIGDTFYLGRSGNFPSIEKHPVSRSAIAGDRVSFSVSVSGTPPFNYQWLKDGVAISDATGAILTIPNSSASDNGRYRCRVSNDSGAVTSDAAALSVGEVPADTQTLVHLNPNAARPSALAWFGNDDETLAFPDAYSVEIHTPASDTLSARYAVTYFTSSANPLRLLQPGDSITASVDVTPLKTNSNLGTSALRVGLFSSRGKASNILTRNENPGVSSTGYASFARTSNGQLRIYPRQTLTDEGGDATAYPLITSSTPYQDLGGHNTNYPTTNPFMAPLQKGQTYKLSHSITLQNANTVVITTTLSGGHLDEDCVSSRPVTATILNDRELTSAFDSFAVAIAHASGVESARFGNLRISVPQRDGAPAILNHPQSQRLVTGSTAVLSVLATGSRPMTYQWHKDGIAIPLANNSTLVLENLALADSADYSCTVGNQEGSLSSHAASLLVRTPETIRPVELNPFFADHMVLQRNQSIPVWGTANPNETLSITLSNGDTILASISTTADAEGKFLARLPAQNHSATPHTLSVEGLVESVSISDVLIGDLWLCSGQSNMAWTVRQADNPGIEIPTADQYPNIRFYKSAKSYSHSPLDSNPGTWSATSAETIGDKSAVAYFFARTLAQTSHRDIPLGMLDVSYGGTVIETWGSREFFLQHQGNPIYDAILSRPDINDPDTPCGTYNAMIHPIRHAALKGILWYQGEDNVGQPDDYSVLFPNHILHWRQLFGNSLPFYFVQLANRAVSNDPAGQTWALQRHSQTAALALPNTGMAVTIDIGDDNNIHPTNKQDVGLRLALIALRHLYGYSDLEYSGPVPLSASSDAGGQVILTLAHLGGLHLDPSKNRPGIPAFQLAGEDGIFHEATATISPNNTYLLISSPSVPSPAQLRYAWHNTPSTPLYNTTTHPLSGTAYPLPASPFRMVVTEGPNLADLTEDELIAYAFSGDGSTSTNGTLSHLPLTTISPSSGKLQISFTPAQSGLQYEVQQSSDLETWITIDTIQGGSTESISVEATADAAIDPNLFLRIRISPAGN